jgi:hypothetical protein
MGAMDKSLHPENELSRSNFFELLVRISIVKYIKTKKKVGARKEEPMTHIDCFHKLMLENVIPSTKKAMEPVIHLETFRSRQVLTGNPNLRKFLFLNQFNIK